MGDAAQRGNEEKLELRCAARFHANIVNGRLEVPCRFCKSDPGETVLHYFDLVTGELIETKRYQSALKLVKR